MATIIHAVLGYIFLLLSVRVLSRRPGAQLTLFEFVLIFLMGGVIILSTMGDDHSETNAVCAVLVVGLMHRLVSYVKSRFPRWDEWLDGVPLVLLEQGKWQTDVMNRMRVQDTDVMAAAREQGVRTLEQIKYAVLERNGSISIIQEKKSQ
ncbi:MAG: DUF421 domain-containing protein [Acidobacteriaceae bacterium]|nr:DUF421 domain-containing protein [Acidobacteriaceae bacterium]